jgi:hypothetical protein
MGPIRVQDRTANEAAGTIGNALRPGGGAWSVPKRTIATGINHHIGEEQSRHCGTSGMAGRTATTPCGRVTGPAPRAVSDPHERR